MQSSWGNRFLIHYIWASSAPLAAPSYSGSEKWGGNVTRNKHKSNLGYSDGDGDDDDDDDDDDDVEAPGGGWCRSYPTIPNGFAQRDSTMMWRHPTVLARSFKLVCHRICRWASVLGGSLLSHRSFHLSSETHQHGGCWFAIWIFEADGDSSTHLQTSF